MDDLIKELERRCPGCSFTAEPSMICILEYGRKFVVPLDEVGMTAKEWFQSEIDRRPLDEVPPPEPDEKYKVHCHLCGSVVIGYGNYRDQMRQANARWYCPQCGGFASFDDENYESYFNNPA